MIVPEWVLDRIAGSTAADWRWAGDAWLNTAPTTLRANRGYGVKVTPSGIATYIQPEAFINAEVVGECRAMYIKGVMDALRETKVPADQATEVVVLLGITFDELRTV